MWVVTASEEKINNSANDLNSSVVMRDRHLLCIGAKDHLGLPTCWTEVLRKLPNFSGLKITDMISSHISPIDIRLSIETQSQKTISTIDGKLRRALQLSRFNLPPINAAKYSAIVCKCDRLLLIGAKNNIHNRHHIITIYRLQLGL